MMGLSSGDEALVWDDTVERDEDPSSPANLDEGIKGLV